jgi:dihydrofolate synthase/folylpolyglutamate synthase
VDLDHQEHLGNSLRAIAGEKAGVMRAGRTTVLGPLAAAPRRVFGARAAALGARLVEARGGARVRVRGRRIDVTTPAGRYPGLRPLPGAHQRDNLLVAVRLLEAARAAGLERALRAVPRGVNATRWPGRLERVAGRPPLILDGAHNPAAARALAAEMARRRPFVLLFGAMADKDVPEIAKALFPLADGLVLTAPSVPRAARPEDVQARAAGLAGGALLEPTAARALAAARRLAGRGRSVLVAGSLYLVGEVKARLEREARLGGRRA